MRDVTDIVKEITADNIEDGLLDRDIHMVSEFTASRIKKNLYCEEYDINKATITFLPKACVISYSIKNEAHKSRALIAHELGHVVERYLRAKGEQCEDVEQFAIDFAKALLINRSRFYDSHLQKDPDFLKRYAMPDDEIKRLVDEVCPQRKLV